jgi:hypothetical protein
VRAALAQPPNTRVQRTRSSPSAPHSPLTRNPLGAPRQPKGMIAGVLIAAFVVSAPARLVGQEWVMAAKTGERRAAEYRFTSSGQEYVVKANGSLAVSAGNGFKLPVSNGDFIETLYALGTGDQVAIAYQAQNDETVVSRLVSLSLPGLDRRWEAQVGGLNLGLPAVASGYAYVTAAGFVGKIDLASGRWAWRQDDLTKKYNRFESFGQPVVGRGFVTVSEDQPEAFEHKAGASLVLDDNTGEILESK